MVNTYKIKESFVPNGIMLRPSELMYLRLFVHDFCSSEKCEFLDIDLKRNYHIRSNLYKKFGSKSWMEIVCKAFKIGVLKKEDYIDDVVKRISLEYTRLFFGRYREKDLLVKEEIEGFILEYVRYCDDELFREKLSKVKPELTKVEVDYIKYKYQNLKTPDILRKLSVNVKKLKDFEQSIFYELGASNWFNVFRKAFQLKILERRDYWSIAVDKGINKTIEELYRINKSTINQYEKEANIYSLLNKTYGAIEFYYLLNKEIKPY